MFDPIDEDRITCEHCGLRYYPEVGMGHICQEGIDAAKKETEVFNRRYQGTGKRIKVLIQIELECYDSPDAVHAALDCIELYSSAEKNKSEIFSGYDDVLDCSYSVKRIVK